MSKIKITAGKAAELKRRVCLSLAAVFLAVTGTESIVTASEASGPANPVHNCTIWEDWTGDTDMTKWSYIYFGSYPQTEVTGTALTPAIVNASYDTNGDAWVNGRKYRRLSYKDSPYNFEYKEQRFFLWEQIRWRVLQNDGSTLFVLADLGLDSKDYHESSTSVTWETSSIRDWLNNTFYRQAFSGGEQDAIREQEVINEDHPEYGTEGGNNTRDNVFLLSLSEALNPEYGFCERDRQSAGRRYSVTDYAKALMLAGITEREDKYNGKCSWWLRSPGEDSEHATEIDVTGNPSEYSYVCSNSVLTECVVPALHIDISSPLWSENPAPPPADSGNGNESTNENTNGNGGGVNQQVPEVRLVAPKLSAKIVSANGVRLSWNKVSGAQGYYVYRATSKNGSYKQIKKLKGISYVNNKLKSNKTYYYKIAAYAGSKVSEKSQAVSKKVIGPLKTPKLKSSEDRNRQTYTLTWSVVKNAQKIEILRDTGNGSDKRWKTLPIKKKRITLSYKSMKRGTQYNFKVRAYYIRDGKKIRSKESKKVSLSR